MAGYDDDTVDGVVKESLRCELCQKILRDAKQTGSGYRACEICYDKAKEESEDKTMCPFDNSVKAMVFDDKAARKEVASLKSFCKNKAMGCEWYGALKELEKHLQDECQFNFPPVPEEPLASVAAAAGAPAPAVIAGNTNIDHLMLKLDHLQKELLSQFQKNIELERSLKDLSIKYKSQQGELDSIKHMLYRGQVPGSNTNTALEGVRRELHEVQLSQSIMENVNYDGRSIWKISNFTQRMRNAEFSKNGLHSAPCYTHKYGYKFHTRLYLNGDGTGKGTHLSIFFVLVQSEYDALLKWPFSGRVTFKLLNPKDSNASVVETISLNNISDSTKQPTSRMNMAVGVPLFMDKNELQRRNFILDDSIYVETVVELI